MLMLLSWDEPADAVRSQDGVHSEACDEEDREDQQPVDSLHRDAGEGAKTVCIHHFSVGGSIKPCNSLPENKAGFVSNVGIHIVLLVSVS